MGNHPIINLIWLLFVMGVVILAKIESHLITLVDAGTLSAHIFYICMNTIMVIIPMICAIGICQFIGNVFAKEDEADIFLVLNNKIKSNTQPPILIYKKTDRKTGVTEREFYTSFPMEIWKEYQNAICDRLDVHLISDFSYGGKKHNKGNHICFISAEGRIPEDRGDMYDEEF